MTQVERSLEPDAEQVEAQRARTLLELVDAHVRQALALPDQVETLQSIAANLLFENAAFRYQIDQLTTRIERLERRNGGGH